MVSIISSSAFYFCQQLSTVILNYNASTTSFIGATAFNYCYRLLSLYLLGSSLFTLYNINAFNYTPISSYTTFTDGVRGKQSLYDAYYSNTNWATYGARLVSLTDTEVQNVITYGRHDP